MEKDEAAGSGYIPNRISEILHSEKNFWKQIYKLGLQISETSNALHGFMSEELNAHFSNIAILYLHYLTNFTTM